MRKNKSLLNIYTVIENVRIGGRIETQSLDEVQKIIKILEKNKVKFHFFESIYMDNTFDIVFSKDKRIVIYLYLISIKKIDTTNEILGKIFGYPKCCMNNKHLGRILLTDEVEIEHRLTLSNTKGSHFPYYMNVFVNEYRMVFHVPCSLNCTNTQKLGNTHLNILKKKLSNKSYTEYILNLKGKFKDKYIFE